MKPANMIFLYAITILSTVQAKTGMIDLHGLWIDEGYDYTIRSSHSPRAASHTTIVPAISIDSLKTSISVCYNFHEGIDIKIVSIDKISGKVTLSNHEHELILEKGKLFFSHIDYDKQKRNRLFIRISQKSSKNVYEDVQKYVTPVVIDGVYEDANTMNFSFIGKKAVWPKKQFNWIIIIDCVEFDPIDVLCEVDSNDICKNTYGFVSNGGILQIYEYDDNRKTIGPILYDLVKK